MKTEVKFPLPDKYRILYHLYIVATTLLELTKMLNQKGFHKMRKPCGSLAEAMRKPCGSHCTFKVLLSPLNNS